MVTGGHAVGRLELLSGGDGSEVQLSSKLRSSSNVISL